MTEARQVRSVAVIGNTAFSLANFRGPLISSMVERGVRVYALAPDYEDASRDAVRALGAEPVDISLERTGLHPIRDVIDLLRLAGTLRRLRPDLVFSYFMKPVIYGTVAAFLAGIRRRYALVAGLGYVFTPDGSPDTFKRFVLRTIVSGMYAVAFRLCGRVFLQNDDDLEILCGGGTLPRKKALLINGTGVDFARFQPQEYVLKPVTFILVARLLREKGIFEYVEAARRIKATGAAARFVLLGNVDSNPGGLTWDEVEQWVEQGLIEWPGQVPDVRVWLAQSSVFVLPSYREGKPRSTQEAMAMALPVLTTDAPGCRDTVKDGLNGFKVPVRDAGALETAMRRFIDEPELIPQMGRESRILAEELFDVHRINRVMLEAMKIS